MGRVDFSKFCSIFGIKNRQLQKPSVEVYFRSKTKVPIITSLYRNVAN